MKTKNLVLLFILFSFGTIFSQGKQNQELIDKALKTESLENQFTILLDKSPNFQQFKNIKQVNLNKYKKNFKDSLQAISVKFSNAYTKIATQQQEINKLKQEIDKLNNNVSDISKDKDSISFFGTRVSKATYNTILWSLIFGLLATTLLLLFKFRSSNSVTKEAKKSLLDLEEEFEQHRKKALEREQVLRRKLQDEINKQR